MEAVVAVEAAMEAMEMAALVAREGEMGEGVLVQGLSPGLSRMLPSAYVRHVNEHAWHSMSEQCMEFWDSG